MKMQSIPISKYFEVVHPEYTYLKLVPVKSTRNYNSDKIIHAVASTYRGIMQRIQKQEKKYFFKTQWKVSFFVHLEKGNAEFYFVIPKECLTLIKEKIGDTWQGVTVKTVDSVPSFSSDATRYSMAYKKEDAMSLTADKRSNVLLESILSTLEVMEEGDRVAVLYNFVPRDQEPWRAKYDETLEKLKKGTPIDKNVFRVGFALRMIFYALSKGCEFLSDATSEIIGTREPTKEQIKGEVILNPETKKKRESVNVTTQIITFSESVDTDRQRNNAIALCENYKSVSGDNELAYHRINPPKIDNEMLVAHYPGAEKMCMSAAECSNFVALPGREILEQHKAIEHIEVIETQVPEELRTGIVRVGKSTYRGTPTHAFLTNDTEYKHLSLVLVGPTRSGKTTLVKNISSDTVRGGQCTILFDFCGHCELSNEVSPCVESVLNIDCSDFKSLQGLGYNEVDTNEPDQFLRYRNAKMITMQLITLINSIVDDSSSLSAKMDRYLECAALITFINGGSINNVFRVLQDYKYRHKAIDCIPQSQKENLEEYLFALEELDEQDKKTNEPCGTKYHLIAGIIDRVNRLKQNAYMEMMLKRDCKRNINLVEELQKHQLICLRMPESMFATESEKDIYCTYWMTKIWLALQIRKQVIKDKTSVNIIVDELYQVPQCQNFIRSKLSQLAKYSARMIISCHYLGQIKIIRNELKAANSSYIIMSGSDKDNFSELKEELAPFEVEDVLSLKRYHAICLLKYSGGYARFVAHLPPPPKIK